MTGIHTLDDLRARCWIEEETKCWHWRAGRDAHNVPKCWNGTAGRTVSLGTMIGFLTEGVMPERGTCWFVTCKTPDCANPAHRKAGTKSQQMKAAKYVPSELTKLRIRATKRASTVLTSEDAATIRGSSETAKALGERFGISISYAARIRRGQHMKPLTLPAASVFNWSAA